MGIDRRELVTGLTATGCLLARIAQALVAFWHGLRGRLDKLANRFGVLRVCRRLHRAI